VVVGGANGSRVGQEDSRLLPRSEVQKGESICIHAIIRPNPWKLWHKYCNVGRSDQAFTPSKLDILEMSVWSTVFCIL